LRGYRDLHLRALKRLAPGGRLVTYSCSHHVSREQFLTTVVEAAGELGRTLRLEAITTQSADHPILPAIPETEYLKGFVLTVVD
jgi:23S rRNA (cytosine1962-C5)-methyltransferase